jgi:hypothetical protein
VSINRKKERKQLPIMESAAQSLIGNVGQLLNGEYQHLRGVGEKMAELRDDLDAMNALLVMQSEVEDGAVDRRWTASSRCA